MYRIKVDSDVANRNKLVQNRDSLFDKATCFAVVLLTLDFLLHFLLDVLGQTLRSAGRTLGSCIVVGWILREPLDNGYDISVFFRLLQMP